MCAIVDANVAHEVFGPSTPPAGREFLDWLSKGRGRLVVGGKLHKELKRSKDFGEWAREFTLAGKMRVVDASEVNARTNHVRSEGACASDDPHVVALAQVSGARLLYSNDRKLQKDFRNKQLIDDPRGSVYSTQKSSEFRPAHKRLLSRQDLCRAQ